MKITNCKISIVYSSMIMSPPNTMVGVTVSEEIMPGVSRVKGTFELNFDTLYFNHDDPALRAAINTRLESIPE